MDFSEGDIPRLLERHQSLVNLAKFLSARERFFSLLRDVQEFEKNVEEQQSTAASQCSILSAVLDSESRLKGVLSSQEWQDASEYFVVPSNESRVLDTYYRLEIGSAECSGDQVFELRRLLLRRAFFQERPPKRETELDGVGIRFVFSREIPRWSLEEIEWEIEKERGTERILGRLVISVGFPNPDGPPLYRDLFAWCGSEKLAVSMIAVHGLHKADPALQETARDILSQIDFCVEELAELIGSVPELADRFAEWKGKEAMAREFSAEGIAFLRDAMIALRKKGSRHVRDRLTSMGFVLRESESCVHDFSDRISAGEIVSSLPAVEYYWPYEDYREIVLPGENRISAGPKPAFLEMLERFVQSGLLEPRPADLNAVKQLLLFLVLGEEKIAKPPLLPVYNALRRWLECLENAGKQEKLEEFCRDAVVFRPYIQIPSVGEKPFTFGKKEHQLLNRESPGKEAGTILGIKQAGIVVPDAHMPLFLRGVYWVSGEETKEAK